MRACCVYWLCEGVGIAIWYKRVNDAEVGMKRAPPSKGKSSGDQAGGGRVSDETKIGQLQWAGRLSCESKMKSLQFRGEDRSHIVP